MKFIYFILNMQSHLIDIQCSFRFLIQKNELDQQNRPIDLKIDKFEIMDQILDKNFFNWWTNFFSKKTDFH